MFARIAVTIATIVLLSGCAQLKDAAPGNVEPGVKNVRGEAFGIEGDTLSVEQVRQIALFTPAPKYPYRAHLLGLTGQGLY